METLSSLLYFIKQTCSEHVQEKEKNTFIMKMSIKSIIYPIVLISVLMFE